MAFEYTTIIKKTIKVILNGKYAMFPKLDSVHIPASATYPLGQDERQTPLSRYIPPGQEAQLAVVPLQVRQVGSQGIQVMLKASVMELEGQME